MTWGDFIVCTVMMMFISGTVGAFIGNCNGTRTGIKQGRCEAIGGRVIDDQCMRVEPLDGGGK